MTEVPPSGPERPDEGGSDPTVGYPGAPPAAYPSPYGGDIVTDDELAAALAAQTAMYTGPITLPVVNSDPIFDPDPAEVHDELPPPAEAAPAEPVESIQLPPVPIPPPAAPPEYIAPDAVASDPEPPESVDAELGRNVEHEAAAGSTLDAILLLENELRRRQGLPPVDPAAEPPVDVSAVIPEPAVELTAPPSPIIHDSGPPGWTPAPDPEREGDVIASFAPPAPPAPPGAFDPTAFAPPDVDAPLPGASVDGAPSDDGSVYGAPVYGAPVDDAPAHEAPGYEVPGFTTPLAENPPAESVVVEDPLTGLPFESDEHLWLAAPPPSFDPPQLVEPPFPEAPPLDPATLTPTPLPEYPAPVLPPPVLPAPIVPPPLTTVEGPNGPVDVSLLPPPTGVTAIEVPPATFWEAPPPDVEAVPISPPVAPPFAAPVPSAGPAPSTAPASFEALVAPAPQDPETEGIDDLDRVFGDASAPVDAAHSVAPVPVTSSVAAVAVAVAAESVDASRDPAPFEVETVAAEPTPLERRAGHAARLFWLWFAANSSIVMVAVGATLFGFGMSLRQALVAIVAGVAVSALPLGLGTLAGKWSGQPTLIVSRASFGLSGNVIPAILAVLGRVLWGGVVIWLLAVTTASLLTTAHLDGGLGAQTWAVIALAVGVLLAAVVAVFGYGLLHRVQRVLGILSILLVIATIALTAGHVDFGTALQTDDGSWALALGGVVVVFSVVGLAWAQSSSDLARYQRAGGSGAANMLWGSFGVIVPTLVILAWGAVLAASDPEIATGLARDPLATLLSLVPDWFALPLLGASAFGIVSATIVTMYSGGLAVVATGARLSRTAATLVAAVLVAAVGLGLLALGADTRDVLRDVATTLAVPVAAWAGIFASEMMIRLRRFHAPSLLAPGGVYPAVRWANVIGLIAISAIGFGFTSAQLAGLDWQGYLFNVLGIDAREPLAQTDFGVLVSLALGVLLPLATGIPAIRRQERTLGQPDSPDAAHVTPAAVDGPAAGALLD